MTSASKLVLFTGGFPFGGVETFLETEIVYLARGFSQVIIIPVNPPKGMIRELPSNCTVQPLYIPEGMGLKLPALRFIFSRLFRRELHILHRLYGKSLSRGILNTMLVSLARASVIKKAAEKHAANSETTCFYSYWCDDTALALALLKRDFPSLPVCCRMHRWDIYFEENVHGYLPYRHFISGNLDRIVSISRDGIDYAIKTWKIGPGATRKLTLSRLGVRKGITPGMEMPANLLVSCSNLIPVKRVHLIAEALSTITDTPVHWVHFGDGREMGQVKNITEKKFPPGITFRSMGRTANSRVLEWYVANRPRLFINVSSSEGIPVSIMEAMSHSIPVAATDVGGTGEIVNRENGILLSADPCVEEIRNAIRYFFRMSPDEYKRYAYAAYATWNEEYNAEKNYTKFVTEIRTL